MSPGGTTIIMQKRVDDNDLGHLMRKHFNAVFSERAF